MCAVDFWIVLLMTSFVLLPL
ncbi:Protein of unknown function [Bacillus wiedmannii]|uniref:Uncharacterized protein n=1 Tax=Bacillus wiedmannii TaxID=1890302 RepID=A0AB37Z1K5_9BACI|nr:Protein of unknown function [Bacillus wiedmannii]